ncbi:replicative DNA helicase [Nonomuraea sp. NPDC050790]|uniref:replicative DNA helicase n=1 Tax=Nonomuraea sp. NPDC050790 TaxID=3364371 RepID=UPI0037B68A67
MTDLGLSPGGYEASDKVIAAEMAVAGAVVQSRRALDEASDRLSADSFYTAAGAVFAAAEALRDKGDPVEPPAVLGKLQERGDLERVGGAPYLFTLIEHAARDGSVGYYAGVVADDYDRRNLFLACTRAGQMAGSATWDPATDIDHIRKMIDAAAVRRIGERPKDVSQAMVRLLDRLENPPAQLDVVVPPFEDLAQLLGGGFRRGQLICVAGRPGLGKSVLATDFARQAAIEDGRMTIMFSLEMSEDEVLERITAAESQVPLHHIRSLTPSRFHLEAASKAGVRISNAPLIIDETSGCTLEHIRSQLRWLSRETPAELVVIDYLQLMRAPKRPRRDLELGAITSELKEMAGEFKVPIVLLSQLNRESQKRNDKRPAIADLRDSGSIESDSDIVILVHREDAYERETPRAGEADLMVVKHRGGPLADVTVAAQLHYGRFADMGSAEKPFQQQGRPNLHVVPGHG